MSKKNKYPTLPKKSVAVLLCNKENPNLYLGVSRKTDFNDFGCVGGKCEKGETLEQAAIRETIEETGLNITNLREVFADFVRPNKKYICHTFMADYSGAIHTEESGVVKWVSKDELFSGSFGGYNKKLFGKLGL